MASAAHLRRNSSLRTKEQKSPETTSNGRLVPPGDCKEDPTALVRSPIISSGGSSSLSRGGVQRARRLRKSVDRTADSFPKAEASSPASLNSDPRKPWALSGSSDWSVSPFEPSSPAVSTSSSHTPMSRGRSGSLSQCEASSSSCSSPVSSPAVTPSSTLGLLECKPQSVRTTRATTGKRSLEPENSPRLAHCKSAAPRYTFSTSTATSVHTGSGNSGPLRGVSMGPTSSTRRASEPSPTSSATSTARPLDERQTCRPAGRMHTAQRRTGASPPMARKTKSRLGQPRPAGRPASLQRVQAGALRNSSEASEKLDGGHELEDCQRHPESGRPSDGAPDGPADHGCGRRQHCECNRQASGSLHHSHSAGASRGHCEGPDLVHIECGVSWPESKGPQGVVPDGAFTPPLHPQAARETSCGGGPDSIAGMAGTLMDRGSSFPLSGEVTAPLLVPHPEPGPPLTKPILAARGKFVVRDEAPELWFGKKEPEPSFAPGPYQAGIVEGKPAKGGKRGLWDALWECFTCSRTSGEFEEEESWSVPTMVIGAPTNVCHLVHVSFDRFTGFLGLPEELARNVGLRVPGCSASVFGTHPETLQLSYDRSGRHCVPTILIQMQERLYARGGLQAEGIFRITPDNECQAAVRDHLNKGVVPGTADVHVLAGLIKAWFRELPFGVLDSLTPEQVASVETEDGASNLLETLPPTPYALMNWALDLMTDVAEQEPANKMNPRNIAMVFAPNMTQVMDPLRALIHAVEVLRFLRLLVERRLRERSEGVVVPASVIKAKVEKLLKNEYPHWAAACPQSVPLLQRGLVMSNYRCQQQQAAR